jgi:NAD(P)-dependent dehydrogenase (short-subunit alcohol dehydrogenase family)
MTISFEGRVAIVTGAGRGLGRAYALELARRGARVMVNDLGGARDGSGQSDAAEAVAEEIRRAGGEALADGGSVADFAQMETMAARAREAWGGIHILINNAGILRDRSFGAMDMADFEELVRVHLLGSAHCARAVWNTMREQNYGRILMTTSGAGLGGNFGQANYGAAKLGVVGLAKALYVEGARHDIRVNSIAPLAGTRMSEDMLTEDAFRVFDAAKVVPAALFLVSDEAPTNAIVGAGAGLFQTMQVTVTPGILLPEAEQTVEGVAAAWARIADRSGETEFLTALDQVTEAMRAIGRG